MSPARLQTDPGTLPEPQSSWALFFDIDGTLADIAAEPDMAVIPSSRLFALHTLRRQLGGAVALVSGRSLKSMDIMLGKGPAFPAAGQHGLELRMAHGDPIQAQGRQLIGAAAERISAFHAMHPSLIVEYKGLSIAVHYRAAPELESDVRGVLEAITAAQPEALCLQTGKMVCEVRLKNASKGSAIRALMGNMPFKGRTPVFVGDDVTDEDGFAAVNELGGISIKIGDGKTIAAHRLATPWNLEQWLHGVTQWLDEDNQKENL